jgi:hypothetical protein
LRGNPKPGDIYAIKLPQQEHYAYGRVMKDNAVQFFVYEDTVGTGADIVFNEVRFTLVVHKNFFNRQGVQCVGHKDFDDEASAWPPRTYTYDPIFKKYSIYYKGEIVQADKEQCEGLEPSAVWEADHVIDRLTGSKDWLTAMKWLEL